MNKYKILISIVILILYSCHENNTNHTKIPSFYYWKQSFKLTQEENKQLNDWGIKKIYLKLFDVEWRIKEPIPVAEISISDSTSLMLYEIIPVIYITNEVISKCDSAELATLATNISNKILKKLDNINTKEIQIDCDWSKHTKGAYFNFLNMIKLKHPKTTISCTIRLHQIKYKKETGIPPVDRGMLMLYNLSSPLEFKDNNSILDIQEAKKYFTSKEKYPLNLDFATPAFYWAIRYRDREFKEFITDIKIGEFDLLEFLDREEENFYSVNTDTLYKEHFFQSGDWVKIEAPDKSDILHVLEYGKKIANNDTFSLAPFHFDPKFIQYYEPGFFKALFECK